MQTRDDYLSQFRAEKLRYRARAETLAGLFDPGYT